MSLATRPGTGRRQPPVGPQPCRDGPKKRNEARHDVAGAKLPASMQVGRRINAHVDDSTANALDRYGCRTNVSAARNRCVKLGVKRRSRSTVCSPRCRVERTRTQHDRTQLSHYQMVTIPAIRFVPGYLPVVEIIRASMRAPMRSKARHLVPSQVARHYKYEAFVICSLPRIDRCVPTAR